MWCILTTGLFLLLTTTQPQQVDAVDDVNGYIHIECKSCDNFDGDKFEGSLGSNLVIRYKINETTLHLFKLKYNGSNEIRWKENLVKFVNTTTHDPRLKAVEISKTNPHILEVTLEGLTLDDDGAVFEFDGRDDNLNPSSGQNSVVVTPKKEHKKTSDPVDSDVIVIGIVIGVIIVVMLILMLLLWKGIITLDGCLILCGFGKKSVEEKRPFQWEETDEKVYDAPKNIGLTYSAPPPSAQQQTEYAALGPGGGRMDKPKQKPEKSLYAQVKTEDVDYPPYVEEADSIIV